MQPTYLIVHNFKSIAHIELDLSKFQDKSVLIQAENMDSEGVESNLSGKSNLMKSIMWCLFGVSTIEGTTDEIIRYGEKECYVIIRFGQIEIERRLKGKAQTFFYRKDGKDYSDSNKDAESLFLQDIGLDSKNKAIISNSIYLNSGVDNLINSTAGDRLKTLTDWFDLSYYDRAVEFTREKYKGWNTELSAVSTQIDQAESTKDILKENKKKLSDISNDITYLQNDKKELEELQKVYDNFKLLRDNYYDLVKQQKEIAERNKRTLDYKKDLESFGDIALLEEKERELEEAYNSYKNTKQELERKLSELKNQTVSPYICPSCKTHLVFTSGQLEEVSIEANEKIQKEITEIQSHLSKLIEPESHIKIRQKINEYYMIRPHADRLLEDIEPINKKIKELSEKIGTEPIDYSSEIKETNQKLMDLSFIKGEIQSNLSSIQGLIDRLPELEERSKKLTELCRLSLLWAGERTKVGIFQELKGLTFSKIIRNLTLYVNNILTNHFCIQSRIKLESTSKGIEIYMLMDEEEHPVTSMSSSEKARVAFALALALKQFYSTKLDLLIIDEYFGSLDSTGMEFTIKTMNTFKGMKFLISHVPCESAYQINLIKEKGITYVG